MVVELNSKIYNVHNTISLLIGELSKELRKPKVSNLNSDNSLNMKTVHYRYSLRNVIVILILHSLYCLCFLIWLELCTCKFIKIVYTKSAYQMLYKNNKIYN